MALNEKGKNRLRQVIRSTMIVVAVFLLLIALAIPMVNNGIALGVEQDLKALSMPPQTEMVESISASGRYTGKELCYFGALLVKSELSYEELSDHFSECVVERQLTSAIRATGKTVDNGDNLTFNTAVTGGNYYIVYQWGSTPVWLKGILNMDAR